MIDDVERERVFHRIEIRERLAERWEMDADPAECRAAIRRAVGDCRELLGRPRRAVTKVAP